MNNFFDDVARSLASPMPRRKVFRYIVKGLLGGVAMAALGVRPASAGPCPKGQFVCKGKLAACCTDGAVCCPNVSGKTAHCCPSSHTCCGGSCCKPGYSCSSSGGCVKTISS
jgi:hypothetical protein